MAHYFINIAHYYPLLPTAIVSENRIVDTVDLNEVEQRERRCSCRELLGEGIEFVVVLGGVGCGQR